MSELQITIFEVLFDEERTRIDTDDDLMGWGVQLPNGDCYVDWNREAYPEEDRLEHPHVSLYGSLSDVKQGTGGRRVVVIHEQPVSRTGDAQNRSVGEGGDEIGTVDGFLEDLTELSRRHGLYIIGESERSGYRKFSVMRLNEPHNRPYRYPDVEKVQDGVTFSTLGEQYGYLAQVYDDDGGDFDPDEAVERWDELEDDDE